MQDMMGGFFGLDTQGGGRGLPYAESPGCAYVSSGRAALECLLRSMPRPRRVLVPRFCCDTVLQPLQRLGLPVARYGVDDQLRPLPPPDAGAEDVLLLVNYFGLTGGAVAAAAAAHPGPVVVDATTALYAPPLPGTPVFYSLRKFGPVADGGIVCAPFPVWLPEQVDDSARRARFLTLRAEHGARAALAASEEAEASLSAPALRMSPLTRLMAADVDWDDSAARRHRNYSILHQALRDINRLDLPEPAPSAPMCYPLVSGIPGLRDSLIDAGVALPLFWPEVIESTDADDPENRLARTLLPLPLDQRYSDADMHWLIRQVLGIRF